MITHNGTYLGAATHHGMPIVAATLGGKMVFGNRWLHEPAVVAIVAAFGSAEGTEVIRKTNDYLNRIATTDPQRAQALAGNINQFPMIVNCLINTGYKNVIVGDNDSYFKTGIIPTNTMRVDVDAFLDGNNRAFVGSRVTSNNNSFAVGYDPTQKIMYDAWNSRTTYNKFTENAWHSLALDLSQRKGIYDGAEVVTVPNGSFTNAKELYLLVMNTNGEPSFWSGTSCTMSNVAIRQGGELTHLFTPVADNTYFDIVNSTILLNQGAGTATFTIQLTDKA